MDKYRKAVRNYQNNSTVTNARRLLAAYKRIQGEYFPSRDDCETLVDARFVIEVHG